jgi:hypothetical protein
MFNLTVKAQNNSKYKKRNGGFGMKKRTITNQTIKSFERHLIENEKAEATIQKYMRDIRCFVEYA